MKDVLDKLVTYQLIIFSIFKEDKNSFYRRDVQVVFFKLKIVSFFPFLLHNPPFPSSSV
jgi:hypothetical protein